MDTSGNPTGTRNAFRGGNRILITAYGTYSTSHVIFADGEYRQPDGFERAFLLFDESTKPAARQTWSALDAVDGLERSYFEQVGGKWNKLR